MMDYVKVRMKMSSRFRERVGMLRYARKHCGPIGVWVWAVWRFGHQHSRRGPLFMIIYKFLDLVVVRGWAKASIPSDVTIGERVGFVHDANGLVINPHVVIGEDCTIYHQVTIGDIWGRPGAPRIGNGVLIGAGAKVLGPIVIGDFAAIGAGAVVIKDIPEGATAVGNPARIIPPGAEWKRSPRR